MVTYRELETFLTNRVDEQLTSAARSPNLFFPRFAMGGQDNGPRTLLPPGTWAQVRATDGTVLATNPGALADEPAPKLGKTPTTDAPFTVGAPHFRALAGPVQEFQVTGPNIPTQLIAGRLFVAIPLRDVDDTLHRLFVIELVVAL